MYVNTSRVTEKATYDTFHVSMYVAVAFRVGVCIYICVAVLFRVIGTTLLHNKILIDNCDTLDRAGDIIQ